MIFRKLIQKVGLLAMLALLLCATTVPVSATSLEPEGLYSFNCSDLNTECYGTNLVDGIKGSVSDILWVPAGKQITFSCQNGDNNRFQVGCKLFNSDGGVLLLLTAGAYGGNDFDTYVATGTSSNPNGRYYYVSIETGDYTSPYTGTGWTSLSYMP